MLCYVHDLYYRDAGDNLPLKHEADRKLLFALERVQPNTFGERIMKKIVELAMKTELKLGLGLRVNDILGIGEKKVEVPADYAHLISKELHTPVKKHFPRRRIYYNYKDNIWAIDLMEMPKDKKYKYCLVVIDMWTKYLWLIALENKSGNPVKSAFKSLFKQTNRIP